CASASRSLLPAEREGELVHVAPQPVLARLERADDGMPRRRGVPRRVLVRAAVAAPHAAALGAAAKVHPSRSSREALGTAGDAFSPFEMLDRVEVRARRHAARAITNESRRPKAPAPRATAMRLCVDLLQRLLRR